MRQMSLEETWILKLFTVFLSSSEGTNDQRLPDRTSTAVFSHVSTRCHSSSTATPKTGVVPAGSLVVYKDQLLPQQLGETQTRTLTAFLVQNTAFTSLFFHWKTREVLKVERRVNCHFPLKVPKGINKVNSKSKYRSTGGEITERVTFDTTVSK